MKYIFLLLVAFLFTACENKKLFDTGNKEQKPLDFKPSEMIDPQCMMFVNEKKNSAQAVMSDGKTYFFDDVGCLVLWSEVQKEKPVKSFVYTLDTSEYIEAQAAFYSRTEDTPMHHGFGAYKNKNETLIDYKTMREHLLRGEDMTNPAIKRLLLGR